MKLIFALLCLLSASSAFQPLPTLTPGRLITGSCGRTTSMTDFALKAAAEEKEEETAVVSASADGTYYDDEVGYTRSDGVHSTLCPLQDDSHSIPFSSFWFISPLAHNTGRTRSQGWYFRLDEGTPAPGGVVWVGCRRQAEQRHLVHFRCCCCLDYSRWKRHLVLK